MKITDEMFHPEIREMLSRLPAEVKEGLRAVKDEESFRSFQKMGMYDKLTSDRISVSEIEISRDDDSKMKALLLRPLEAKNHVPGMLWLHGGGYVMGSPRHIFTGSVAEKLVYETGCVMLVPDYSLAIDKPYPAALDDSYLSLLWLKEHAQEYGVNQNQIFVGGESAGGGLAAALCLRARDTKAVQIAFQMPLYPMLDDRMNTDSMAGNDAPCWNTETNRNAWKLYLGDLYEGEVPPYAAPARVKDFSGLPPAYTFVGSIEPFYDEVVNYFSSLREAGIEAVCDVYEGCFHGFDTMFPTLMISREAQNKAVEAFRFAAENYFSED